MGWQKSFVSSFFPPAVLMFELVVKLASVDPFVFFCCFFLKPFPATRLNFKRKVNRLKMRLRTFVRPDRLLRLNALASQQSSSSSAA